MLLFISGLRKIFYMVNLCLVRFALNTIKFFIEKIVFQAGIFHMLKAVLPGVKSRGYGRIVMAASVRGKDANPNASAYSTSRAGVITLKYSAGKECAKIDIGINCIIPTAARTRIFHQMSHEYIDYILSKISRERFFESRRGCRYGQLDMLWWKQFYQWWSV